MDLVHIPNTMKKQRNIKRACPLRVKGNIQIPNKKQVNKATTICTGIITTITNNWNNKTITKPQSIN